MPVTLQQAVDGDKEIMHLNRRSTESVGRRDALLIALAHIIIDSRCFERESHHVLVLLAQFALFLDAIYNLQHQPCPLIEQVCA